MSCKANFSEDNYVDLILSVIQEYRNKLRENINDVNKIIEKKSELNELKKDLNKIDEKEEVKTSITELKIDDKDKQKLNKYIDLLNEQDIEKEKLNTKISELNISTEDKDKINKIILEADKNNKLAKLKINDNEKKDINKVIEIAGNQKKQEQQINNLLNNINIDNESKNKINNYVKTVTSKELPKYTCDIVQKYTYIDYVNFGIILTTIVILLYLIYKLHTKGQYSNLFRTTINVFSLTTTVLLLYKFRNLFSIFYKYFMYIYDFREKILFITPILLIIVSIIERIYQQRTKLIEILYIFKVLLLGVTLYIITYNIQTRNYTKFIIMNIGDKLISTKNIKKVQDII